MRDRYFFDKRDWKRRFVKYIIIFGISFVPLVIFNLYCSRYLSTNGMVVFVDCVILLVFVLIGNIIANKIFEKKDAKLERRKKERDELEARKLQIMEDSYAKKRQEKAEAKKKKQEDIVIEVKEEKVTKTSKKKTTK